MKFALALPAGYGLVAAVTWINFIQLPPDGLASLGLMLVVLPVTALDLLLRPSSSPGSSVLMPDGLPYYQAHAVFFAAGVAVVAAALWLLGRWLDRRRAS